MTKTLLCALILSAPAGRAAAQTELQAGLGTARALLGAPPPPPNPIMAALQVAVDGRNLMVAALGTGQRLIDTLDAAKVEVVIESTGGELCVLTQRQPWPDSFEPVINCDLGLAAVSARYAALLIAERAAEFRWKDMPACAEKDFIVASLMARSWLEVGGDRAKLPFFDQTKDAARAARIKAWFSAKLSDYARERRAKGGTTLASLLAANAAEQGGVLKKIADAEELFGRAACESEERGLLKTIDELKARLKELRAAEKGLKDHEGRAKAFAVEEAQWAAANWRLVGAPVR